MEVETEVVEVVTAAALAAAVAVAVEAVAMANGTVATVVAEERCCQPAPSVESLPGSLQSCLYSSTTM